MNKSHSSLLIQRTEGVELIEFLESSMLDPIRLEKIRDELNGIVTSRLHPRLIISFENVTLISSGVLGILMGLQKKAKEKGGEVRVIKVTPELKKLFEVTKIDKMIKVCKHFDDAMEKFKAS